MINTNELMLGNLVSYENEYWVIANIGEECVSLKRDGKNGVIKYISSFATDINPIELTDDVFKKLGMLDCNWKYIHQLQNRRIVMEERELDITPLLSPKPILTTHDGVEVFDKNAIVYVAYEDATNSFDGKTKDKPFRWVVSDSIDVSVKPTLFFSTRELAQSYINQKWAELHPEPIFVTEDGVGMNKGDVFWYCWESGYGTNGHRDAPSCQITYGKPSSELYMRFSTHELAQAYLNKVWAYAEYNNLLKAKSCK
jgi:hypothetical protein